MFFSPEQQQKRNFQAAEQLYRTADLVVLRSSLCSHDVPTAPKYTPMVHRPRSKASKLAKDLQTRLSSERRMACQIACAGAIFYAERFSRKPYHTSILTGFMWVHELLHGNPRCIKDQLGMEKHVFVQLVRKLFTLTKAGHTRHVDLEEQVAIFLYIMVTNLSNRKVGEHFQRSGDTISK